LFQQSLGEYLKQVLVLKQDIGPNQANSSNFKRDAGANIEVSLVPMPVIS